MDKQKATESTKAFQLPQEHQNLTEQDWMIMLHDVVYIIGAVAMIFIFFFRLVTVDGDSMYPTLCNQDQVIMLTGIWYGEPAAGDVVVARVPDFSSDPLIKRIVAVSGDIVDFDFNTGCIFVNGELIQEESLPGPAQRNTEQPKMEFPLQVEEGCVFLLGDNRDVSFDSRYRLIGQVDQRNIIGKVVFLAFPGHDHITGQREYERIGLLEQEASS